MGLFDGIRGQFIDIIEWLDDSRDTIVWRYPRGDNEIKNGAKLIVRESQAAVFVSEGRVADAFAPGTYELTTANLPILSDLKGWKYGFESPFKAEVYFVNMRQFTDFKWGTQNPIMVRDPEFGMVRLRAFGGYAVRVTDPVLLLRELVGTDPQFRTDEVGEYLRQMIVARLSKALATAGVSMLDLTARQNEIGNSVAAVLSEDLGAMGLTIPAFYIENISVPPEVEEAMDKRTSMGVLGDLDRYTKMQAADAMEAAANNPGGGMGASMGMGMGMGMGQAAAESMRSQGQPAPQGQPGPSGQPAPQGPPAPQGVGGPPPLPQPEQWYAGVGGQQVGPMPRGDLTGRLRSGEYAPDTLVWRVGMANWAAASGVPELADASGPQPPALPGQ
ncbi:MAG: SPFH domain-containing protein [Austwickia sp.]|nr:SPFH domain-containing protein [Actinomycetota bacterium]MCB1255384.1 SPFH domain-containing protein [Austwickia sp.]